MKPAGALLVLAGVALGRELLPEEHWRPALGRDLSKYKPRHAKYGVEGDVNMDAELVKNFVKKMNQPDPFVGEKKNFDDICGIENDGHDPRGKIVGGFEAEEHEWPWIVALFIDDMWFCGGALISDEFVLTAAHCAEDASRFDVLAGAHNVRADSEPERVEISSYNGWTHPQWDSNDLSNDLALIRLPQKITFNDNIRPACLPTPDLTAEPGNLVTPIGWGRPSDSASGISPVLRMVQDLPLITNKECNDVYGIVGDGVVCMDTSGGKGTCNGDSGGPLGYYDESRERWIEVGIVSFGASAGCEVGYPSGFTRTHYYLDWIKDQAGIE
eukprot:TRINITY_DN2047_c0_g1_i1.p1 TRINITY_DN2047_c0_g1~~TRINITY_DN2047_c0_g1_i1.p1  ORF type:complete len:358 (-),score=125.82 TRINITY_DN2047_c0_g1_i1:49-1032(-)